MPDTQCNVLIVDDDTNVLAAYKRQHGRNFHLDTVTEAEEALHMVANKGPYAVVISDYKMPGMDGVQFLSRVREIAPETVRMILTGHADLEMAIEAVNEGYIFRLLTKPCRKESLEKAVQAGLDQYALIQAGKRLHSLKRLQGAMESVILGMSTLVEKRDPYTAGHQKRVTQLCEAVARKLGMDEERILALRMAAMVHDIGKIYVPSDFLNKPGKLTEVEFTVIKIHPQVGYDVLKPVDFEWPISQIVLQHHERLDGSGYPGALAGDEILLGARIIAVADVVDAMTSHRPYRPGLGLDQALEEITGNAGRLYDPDIVAITRRLFESKEFTFA